MLAFTIIDTLHWGGFLGFVVLALAVDLGVFHRKGREIRFAEAAFWTAVWFGMAMVFAFFVAPVLVHDWSPVATAHFITGYLVELSLSMDNVFVIAVIFSFFRVPRPWQHRVLFWGILGALVMRGSLIIAGAALIERFHWLLYALGAFLVISGSKMLFVDASDDEPDIAHNPVIRIVRRCFPISDRFDGEKLVTHDGARRILTPLALVLVVVETTDVVFAVDSIPAIFGITTNPFVVFTSNIFAILGLRSLYFVLASAMGYFRYLKTGLAWVLVAIGVKMVAEPWLQAWLGDRLKYGSIGVVLGLIVLSIAASIIAALIDRAKKPPKSI
jgi:tellurite resistance protein TerC